METRAGYIAVGIAVLTILAAAVVFTLWMADQRAAKSYRQYWIDFEGSIAGLRVGSTVAYRGISVGQVVGMEIRPDNVERVRVTVEIDSDTPIKTDTIARLETQGLAGGSLVQLGGGTQAAPPIAEPADGLPVIPSEPSRLEQLFDGAPALVDRIDALVIRAMLLLDDRNQQAISAILQNSEELTGNLATASRPAGELIGEAHTTLVKVREAAERMERLSAVVEAEVPEVMAGVNASVASMNTALVRATQALVEVEGAARKIGNASAQLDGLIAENRPPIRDFTNVTLYDANAFIAEVRELVISLRQVANDLNRNPRGFLFGNQQQGYEAR